MPNIPFEAFLAKFSELKAKTNSKPNNLRWRAKNEPRLGELASDLWALWRDILCKLETSPRKFAVSPTPTFPGIFHEYGQKWKDAVEAAGAEWINARFEEVLKDLDFDALQDSNPELVENLSRPPNFDPIAENPYELIDEIFRWADLEMEERQGTDIGDDLHKAFQAWDYFESIIGVDLRQISCRWSKAKFIFVPAHVAAAHGPDEPGSLFQLLNEAHKAFVFGAHGAAVAMCRALTESILKKHYGVSEGDLKDITILAEKKYPALLRLNLDKQRKLANRVLHRNETASEDAVLEFLWTVKALVEGAPAARS